MPTLRELQLIQIHHLEGENIAPRTIITHPAMLSIIGMSGPSCCTTTAFAVFAFAVFAFDSNVAD